MATKSINYMARTFEDIQSELISLSNKYYPTLSRNFGNDSSISSWFVDLVSAVGDDLSYYIDRAYQETNIDSATTRKTVLNIAKTNGLKVPGPKASSCEVELGCVLPVSSDNIAAPDWNYAPMIRRGATITNGSSVFEIDEDVNFGEQFNSDGYSNRRYTPRRNSNNNVTGYTVYKSTIAVGGMSRVYSKIISYSELEPFFEVILPDLNVMNVESILFKESSASQATPSVSEYYVDEEVFQVQDQSVKTYRFFEVDSLADQYRFATATNIDENLMVDRDNPEIYDDYTETIELEEESTRTTRIYRGEWKPITQKFITEYTDNGYLKITFGSGVLYDEIPEGQTVYGDYRMSKVINNDMLGILPEAGWSMFVLYKVGGGINSNIAAGSINSVTYASMTFPSNADLDSSTKGSVSNSLTVTNTTIGIGGKDAPSVSEIKNLVKYNTCAQDRCVTLKDYKTRVMQMPPKYGAPFRCNAIEENNKISMALLNVNSNGQLTTYLPSTLVSNMLEWLSRFKTIGDYVEIKSGKIYNLGFGIDVFIDKNYDTANVISSIVATIQDYLDINEHDMADDIFIGDLEKEVTILDGVLSLIDFRVYNLINGNYSSDICPLQIVTEGDNDCTKTVFSSFNVSSGAEAREIDLTATDRVLYGEYNGMYEIKNSSDIQVRAKLK